MDDPAKNPAEGQFVFGAVLAAVFGGLSCFSLGVVVGLYLARALS